MMVRGLTLILLVTTFAWGQKAGEVPRVQPTTKAPKNEVLEWTSAQGKPYWYRLPKKIGKKSPPNLVIMLHGTGMRWGWAFWNYPIASGGFRRNDIVIAPEGMTPGGGDTFNFVQGKTDGEQIAGLIEHFRDQFPIGRVYLYGHSQGAFFCYWFAGAYTRLVDGIVAHAGNLLDVDHNKLAKKKVAIGILHGRADAVVPVECAYRTEKIYKDQGYAKIKLYVVEGLTDQSGHWPLPVQAAEMFEWLDQVSTEEPSQLADVAKVELLKPAPDAKVFADAVRRLRKSLAKYRGDDKDALLAATVELEGVVAELAARHAAAIAKAGGDAKTKEAAPWVAHFRVAHQAFRKHPDWNKSMKPYAARAKRDEKTVQKAISRAGAKWDKKAFAAARKALQSAWFARSYDDLVGLVSTRTDATPRGVNAKDLSAFKELVAGARPRADAGRKAAAEVTSSATASHRPAPAEK